MRYLVIFYTFSGVMQLERALKKREIIFETMPAPRKLSVDCGVSLTFDHEDINQLIESVNTTNIYRIYKIEEATYVLVYENN